MLYQQSIEQCLSVKPGENRLLHVDLDEKFSVLAPALVRLKAEYDSHGLALLRVPEESKDIEACENLAGKLLQDARDVVVLGTGGSSLGAQALAQLKGYYTPAPSSAVPRLHFLDNLDALSMDTLLARLDFEKARVLIVSKSGGTAETMMQALAFLHAYEKAGLKSKIKSSFAAIVEPGDNPLRRLTQAIGCEVLEHNPRIGGRYAVLTNVGLLPARLLGLNMKAVRRGALSVLQPLLEGVYAQDYAPAIGAAVSMALAEKKNIHTTVLMPYADALDRFAAWYRQLWAESLGKKGKGTTPIRALGPVDQHSQLQLYLAGPKDKLFTIMTIPQAGHGPRISTNGDASLAYLHNRTIGDLVDAEARATVATLAANDRPVRLFTLPRLDEDVMGALFMHFMLETILAAGLLGIDPFDQPAVEEGKILAKRYLNEMGN